MAQPSVLLRILLVGLLLGVAGLAGCTSSDPRPIAQASTPGDVVIRIPPGAYDPTSGGPWYSPSELPLLTPGNITWINDDIAWHRMLAYWEPAADFTPIWAQGALKGDGHGHSHGDTAGNATDESQPHTHGTAPAVFDISLDPGQTLTMAFDGEGRLMVHCHPHPWMASTWDVETRIVREYPVTLETLVVQGTTGGTSTAVEGGAVERTWNLGDPNLVQVAAVLTWNDGEDDLLGNSDLNLPDTLRLSILDAAGNVAAQAEATARLGQLPLVFNVTHDPWPPTVPGMGVTEARANLTRLHPDSTASSGTWTFRVEAVASPGPTDQASLPEGVPGSDGKQNWNLTIEARHVWPVISAGPGSEYPVARPPL